MHVIFVHGPPLRFGMGRHVMTYHTFYLATHLGCIDGIYRIVHIVVVHQGHPSRRICRSIPCHHIRKEGLRRYEVVCLIEATKITI